MTRSCESDDGDPAQPRPWLVSARARRLGLACFGFGALWTALVATNDLLPGEKRLMRWVLQHVAPWFTPVSNLLDELFTDLHATLIFVAIVPVVWLWRGRWACFVFLLAGAITSLAKLGDLVARPRPTRSLRWSDAVGIGGYPSGHVVYFVLIFGTLALLATDPRWSRRSPLLASVLVLVVIVSGMARLVALDHWPADVIGAYLLAVPALVAVANIWYHGPTWWARMRGRVPNRGFAGTLGGDPPRPSAGHHDTGKGCRSG